MNKSFKIGNKTISAESPAFIVAEISANHNQDYNRALEIIHAAKEAGADAVKLQTYTASTEVKSKGEEKHSSPSLFASSLSLGCHSQGV